MFLEKEIFRQLLTLLFFENTEFKDILLLHIDAEEATSYSPVNISLKYLPNTKMYRILNIVAP